MYIMYTCTLRIEVKYTKRFRIVIIGEIQILDPDPRYIHISGVYGRPPKKNIARVQNCPDITISNSFWSCSFFIINTG